MKKILFLISLVALIGCNDVKKNTVAKKSVFLKQSNVSAFTTLSAFETHPDTFALFFLPQADELTWSSSLFNDGDSYENKLTRIMTNIISLSNKRDALDKEIFVLGNSAATIDSEIEAKDCFNTPTQECDDLDAELTIINNDIASKTTLSSEHLKGIQQSVDKDINNPVNWQEYGGDAKAYEFDINELTKEVKILMPKLGPYDQRYSSKDGDIVEIVYRASDYNPEVRILTFLLLEKGQFGQRTGAVYEFKLEKSSYLNKVRFKGDVVKRINGDQVQRGICKFELPVIAK